LLVYLPTSLVGEAPLVGWLLDLGSH